jgi:hypothetical protein
MREVREACASLPVVDSLEKGRKPPTLLTRAIGSKKLWCPPTMRRLAVGRRRESVHKLLRVAGFAALAAIMLALLAQGGVASSAGAAPYVVVLKQGVDSRAVANLHAQRYGVDVGFVYGHALKGYSAVVAEARVDDLRADANVAFLSPDGEVSATAQTLPTGVDRIEGDQSSTVSGNGSGSVNVPVAVIDTGIDLDHPDLNVVGGVNCSSGPSFDDGNGHGTHVAGTIGAKDDGVGIVGMAPGTPLRRPGAQQRGLRVVRERHLRGRLGDRERGLARDQGREHEPRRLRLGRLVRERRVPPRDLQLGRRRRHLRRRGRQQRRRLLRARAGHLRRGADR